MGPYWVTTEKHRFGFGITANSGDDAVALYRIATADKGAIISVRAISDMRKIDQNHVAPNMGNWFLRGVWYPLGYEQISN